MITRERSEQAELREATRRLLSRHPVWPDADVTGGYDSALWSQLAAGMGVAGLAIPEEFGGSGAGVAELAVVAEELGRTLAPTPFVATAGLGVPLLLAAGATDDLAALASGDRTLAVVYRGPAGEVSFDTLPVSATEDGKLVGSARFVIDGHLADLLLVVAATPAGPKLFAVEVDAPGITRTPMATLDHTRAQSEVTFDRTPGRDLAADAWTHLGTALDVAGVVLAAEQVGGADRALEMAVTYASSRLQFGRPIGSFQAIKHRCADLAVDNDRARSALVHAVWAATENPARLPAAAAMAADVASEAFTHAARENVHIHGGIGFTWEHSAHLYVRRSISDAVLLRDPADHAERLLTAIGVAT